MANLLRDPSATVASEGDPWIPADTFASRLRLLRFELGLSAEDVAILSGYKPSTWATWEKGVKPRGQDEVVAQIAERTGCDRDWLMWGTRNRCFALSAEVREAEPLDARIDDGEGVVKQEEVKADLSTEQPLSVMGQTDWIPS